MKPIYVVQYRTAFEMGRPAGEWHDEKAFDDYADAVACEREVYARGWLNTQIVARAAQSESTPEADK